MTMAEIDLEARAREVAAHWFGLGYTKPWPCGTKGEILAGLISDFAKSEITRLRSSIEAKDELLRETQAVLRRMGFESLPGKKGKKPLYDKIAAALGEDK